MWPLEKKLIVIDIINIIGIPICVQVESLVLDAQWCPFLKLVIVSILTKMVLLRKLPHYVVLFAIWKNISLESI